MSAAVWLAAASVAMLCATFPVARFSRWRWLSPWHTPCVIAAAALTFASGALSGDWKPCVPGAVIAAVQAVIGFKAAAVRRALAAGENGGEDSHG